MEYTDSEPQKSDLPGSVDSGKLSSVGQTIRWSDVRITDPDDDNWNLTGFSIIPWRPTRSRNLIAQH